MSKKLSIIIVTYNSESVIQECLESIEKYNDIGDELEIIIVDNSPIFTIEEFIHKLHFDLDIKMIHNPKNGGFGQGNNIGVKASHGDILLILNADTIIIEAIFSYILEEFENPFLTVAGFKLIGRNGMVNDSFAFFPEYNYMYFFIPIKLLYFLVLKLGMFSKSIFPWGADLIVRKKDFIDAGMFDENIFLCNEEPDLIKRLNVSQVKIFNKSIIHLEGHTTEISEVRFNEWYKSAHYYFEKYNLNFNLFLQREIKLNNFKIKIRRLLGLDVEHLIKHIKLINKHLN